MEKIREAAIELRVPPSSEILNQTAVEVTPEELKLDETQTLIDELFRVAAGRQGDAKYPTLVGLAAPQIGVLKRVVLIGINAVGGGEQPDLQEFINPTLSEVSETMTDGREGCFSTGRVCGIVERAEQVRVSGLNRNGEKISMVLKGFPARIAQHEIDHLNGVRFPDRIKDPGKLHWVEEAEFGEYRENWASWPTLCPPEKWQAIKTG